MPPIPVHLKNHADMPRPRESEFYWMTGSGLYMCRNHPFFQTDVPATRLPNALARHAPACHARFPQLPAAVLEYAVGFVSLVYDLHGSESIVLFLWDTQAERYRLLVPPQHPTVWESAGGRRSALDVGYRVPGVLPEQCLLVGDLHGHADFSAHPSQLDRIDETYRDGLHLIVGRIGDEPPEFHAALSVDGYRFPLDANKLTAAYRRRRTNVPRAWLDQVNVIVKRPQWTQGYSMTNTTDFQVIDDYPQYSSTPQLSLPPVRPAARKRP
ncbi:MAG: hypothetical protein RBS80_14560 [Thermoguttaceae bacterium]|jgi:hypothetical protein|nr:hypothetical protein [Thermoguttaceae bacterium]